MKLFNAILQNGETEQEAIDYARGFVWGECESIDTVLVPKYQRFIKSVDGIDVYYDYGADYYFFAESES